MCIVRWRYPFTDWRMSGAWCLLQFGCPIQHWLERNSWWRALEWISMHCTNVRRYCRPNVCVHRHWRLCCIVPMPDWSCPRGRYWCDERRHWHSRLVEVGVHDRSLAGHWTNSGSNWVHLKYHTINGDESKFRTIFSIRTLTSLIVIEAHSTIALIVLSWHTIWAIDRQLKMIWSQAMTMRVRIGEQTT